MKIVITIVGKDRVGIIATCSSLMAEHGVNILNINQNILEGYFNMVMIADMSAATCSLVDFQKLLQEKGTAMGMDIKVQHEDIFNAMHRI